MADIGEIVATLRADTRQFTEGLNQSKTSLLAFGAGSVAVGELASQALTAIGSAALSALTAVGRWAAEAGAAAERTEQLSMRIGMQERALEGWGVALNRVGLQQESLAQSMRTLSRHMTGLEQGQEKSVELFAKLGLSMNQAEMAGSDTEMMLRAVADKFATMSDGAEKSRLAVELFGRSGLQLIPLLNQGAAGLDAAAKKAMEFGLVLTDSQRTSLKQFDDSLDDIGSALQGFRTQVAAAFAPSLAAMVKLFTEVIAGATHIVQELATAFDKLTTRLGAMVAAVEIIAKQLFSLNVLSKEAWQETMQMVEAIDKETAARLKSIDAGEKAVKTQKELNEAIKEGATHQKVLGEQIVSGAQIQAKQNAELSKKVFQEIFDQEEEAARIRYLNGPGTNFMTSDQREQERGKRIGEEFALRQAIAQKEVDLMLEEEAAFLKRMDVQDAAYEKAEQNLGQFISNQAIAKNKLLETWGDGGKILADSMSFALGQIRTQFSSTITNAILNGGKLTDLWKGIAATILNTVIQLGIQMIASAAMRNAIMITGEATTAGAITAIWTGAAAGITGLFATVTGAVMGLITGTLMPFLISVGTAVITFLSSIASALDASIFGAPFSIPVWAAVALVGAGLAAALAVFAFAEGGIVTKPTLGLVGEAGPEAIIPLDKLGNMGGKTTIVVELDGKVLMRHVANHLPSILRLKGLPA